MKGYGCGVYEQSSFGWSRSSDQCKRWVRLHRFSQQMEHPTIKTFPHHSLWSHHSPRRQLALSPIALVTLQPLFTGLPSRDQEQLPDSTLLDLFGFASSYMQPPSQVAPSWILRTSMAIVRFRSTPSYMVLHSHLKCMRHSSRTRRLQRTDLQPQSQPHMARRRN